MSPCLRDLIWDFHPALQVVDFPVLKADFKIHFTLQELAGIGEIRVKGLVADRGRSWQIVADRGG